MYRYSMTQWIVGDEEIEYSFQRLKSMAMMELNLQQNPLCWMQTV